MVERHAATGKLYRELHAGDRAETRKWNEPDPNVPRPKAPGKGKSSRSARKRRARERHEEEVRERNERNKARQTVVHARNESQ